VAKVRSLILSHSKSAPAADRAECLSLSSGFLERSASPISYTGNHGDPMIVLNGECLEVFETLISVNFTRTYRIHRSSTLGEPNGFERRKCSPKPSPVSARQIPRYSGSWNGRYLAIKPPGVDRDRGAEAFEQKLGNVSPLPSCNEQGPSASYGSVSDCPLHIIGTRPLESDKSFKSATRSVHKSA
jgi:hypothetical protein